MPDYLTCFACENEPTRQCSRCGRPYCDEHGEELCDSCLQPATGVPSFTLYRGSLLALLIGTALAVWLLIQPGGGESEAGPRPVLLTPTSAAAVAQTPQPNQTQGPAGTAAPGATGTVTPRPTGTTTPSASAGTYTVAAGDSLTGICASQRPALNSADCVTQLRSLNGITGDAISVGQQLRLP
jgi:hypothetical protein